MAKSKLHPVDQYIEDVIQGEVIANKWIRLACQRHLSDLQNGEDRGIYFDRDAGQDPIDFFEEFLVFYEGDFDGKPFILEPWQQFVVWSLFGWKNKQGFRRFRTAYIEIGKGNGKSPMAAGIGLYGLVADGEPGAEIYAAATMREQAGILFRDAKAFADGSPSLQKILTVGVANIDYVEKNSYFRPVSSEHRGLDGKRPHIALIDEIHEHPNAMVVDKMRAGTKGRRQAMIFEITNAGYDRLSVCYQHHEYSEKILQGIINNDSWFAFMAGLDICPKCEKEGKSVPTDGCPNCDQWHDKKVWIKANPNLGVSIHDQYLQEQVDEAKNMPAKQNIVKRLNFCIWTESVTRWLDADSWNACALDYNPYDLKGRLAYGGLDLSSVEDTTSLAYVFPPIEEGEPYKILIYFWVPEDNIRKRSERDRVPYDLWNDQGYLIATPGNAVDYDFVEKQILEDIEKYNIPEIAFDPWNATHLINNLEKQGFTTDEKNKSERQLIAIRQGIASLGSGTKELQKLVLSKKIAHPNNPVLNWQMSNVVVHADSNENYKPDKSKSTERIDGALSIVMALSRAVIHEQQMSVYEDRGVLMI